MNPSKRRATKLTSSFPLQPFSILSSDHISLRLRAQVNPSRTNMSLTMNPSKRRALKRLQRDLVELERANLTSIAAIPLDKNFFEWHVNIKPTEGVYAGIYLHLILTFPDSYPNNPPKVQLCTTIEHPNVFYGSICLSMLRNETGNVPYEGWSGAYSATSVLMQLQSFLFAENIDQDGGYVSHNTLSEYAIRHVIDTCTHFTCSKCGHSHSNPCPPVKVLANEKAFGLKVLNASIGRVTVNATSCDTTSGDWQGVYGEIGVNVGNVFYETTISRMEGGHSQSRPSGICIGFGTEHATQCGRDSSSIGYNATGRVLVGGQCLKRQRPFFEGDTVTVAIDFNDNQVYFAVNGHRFAVNGTLLPSELKGQRLYPLISLQSARIDVNFGTPRFPVRWLMDRGFTSLEQAAVDTQCVLKTSMVNEGDDWKLAEGEGECAVDWLGDGIIEELWLWIFECLSAAEVFRAQRVCRKWKAVIAKYNVAEREEMGCYLSKCRLTERGCTETMGIGLEIKAKASGYGVAVRSQMDILSKSAWTDGCRIGVWGERLTHFLPMVMDRAHSERAHDDIIRFLGLISKEIRKHTVIRNPNDLEAEIAKNVTLRLTDSLISMMNSIVVQFVMENDGDEMWQLRTRDYYSAMRSSKSINMNMCEKVVIGYSAFHHLLLYLKHKNKELITSFADRTVSRFLRRIHFEGKMACKDLGKLLIWTMISSRYQWRDIAGLFVIESFTRRVKWMVKQPKYAKYDTPAFVPGRVQDSFEASKTGRRLAMFQVWFSRNNAIETLQSYNQRLGRPRSELRDGIVAKTKWILECSNWAQYLQEW